MRPILLCLCTFFLFQAAHGQNAARTDSSGDIRDLVRITFLNPGISYEKRIGRLQSLVAQVYAGVGLRGNNNSSIVGARYNVYLEPGGSFQYRYYYNYMRRSDKGLRTDHNNLNFVGPIYQLYSACGGYGGPDYASTESSLLHNIGFVWGFQRNYPKRFSLELGLGIGYMFGDEVYYTYSNTPPFQPVRTVRSRNDYTVLGQFSLGFWLGKR
ncbi:MAG: hypothetical protein EOP50_14080 [Sphingobacteriales bacterium]|nr:MAG: hypothetical protein EOP50_14080 [Sphingobacteriales bacterium]